MIYNRMASLYFCQPHAQNQGMLRAVLKRDDCKHLADPNTLVYLGEEFPKLSEARDGRDFALLRLTAEEANSQWKSGYYRLDTDLMELNARLLVLPG